MEKILATLYLFGVFFVAFVFISFYVSDVIGKLKNRNSIVENKAEPIYEPDFDVVGKSTTAFLAPLIPEKQKPLMSEELKSESAVETEPEILPEEVEANLNHPVVLDEDELNDYSGDFTDWDGNMSKGLTYQQISDAIDVVEGRKSGETDEYLAGEAFSLMPSDFLNVICMQADHEAMVKKLIAGYVDLIGKKPKLALIADFDINQYV